MVPPSSRALPPPQMRNTPGVATTGSNRMTQTRAELRNASQKLKDSQKHFVQHGSFGADKMPGDAKAISKDRDL